MSDITRVNGSNVFKLDPNVEHLSPKNIADNLNTDAKSGSVSVQTRGNLAGLLASKSPDDREQLIKDIASQIDSATGVSKETKDAAHHALEQTAENARHLTPLRDQEGGVDASGHPVVAGGIARLSAGGAGGAGGESAFGADGQPITATRTDRLAADDERGSRLAQFKQNYAAYPQRAFGSRDPETT